MSHETNITITNVDDSYAHRIQARGHHLTTDEPIEVGGKDTGPTPYELLASALGSCIAITVRMYANRKQWPLKDIRVDVNIKKIHAEDCDDCEQDEGYVDVIDKRLTFSGSLTDEQRQRLVEISERCPVHRTLLSNIKIRSSIEDIDSTKSL